VEHPETSRETKVHVYPFPLRRAVERYRDSQDTCVVAHTDNFGVAARYAVDRDWLQLNVGHGRRVEFDAWLPA